MSITSAAHTGPNTLTAMCSAIFQPSAGSKASTTLSPYWDSPADANDPELPVHQTRQIHIKVFGNCYKCWSASHAAMVSASDCLLSAKPCAATLKPFALGSKTYLMLGTS